MIKRNTNQIVTILLAKVQAENYSHSTKKKAIINRQRRNNSQILDVQTENYYQSTKKETLAK